MRDFPIFRRGKYKGGFITVQQNKRQLPFRLLAARTIGYDRENGARVGLEAAYRKTKFAPDHLAFFEDLYLQDWN